MHHIELGLQHVRTHVRMLVHDLHVIVISRDTGEFLRELTIDPTEDSQPRGVNPDPAPATAQTACPRATDTHRDESVPGHHIGADSGTDVRTPAAHDHRSAHLSAAQPVLDARHGRLCEDVLRVVALVDLLGVLDRGHPADSEQVVDVVRVASATVGIQLHG